MQFGKWRVATVSGVQKELQSKAQLLCHSQVNGDANNVEDVLQLRKDTATLLKQEELAWKQRTKQQWLKHEDQNSRFFHQCANQKKIVNHIGSVEDESGRCFHSQQTYKKKMFSYLTEYWMLFTQYFKSIFTSSNPIDASVLLQDFTTGAPSEFIELL